MKNNGTWRAIEGEVLDSKSHSVIIRKLARNIPELDRETDKLMKKEHIRTIFKTTIEKRSDFIDREVEFKPINSNKINCFTDGSKTEEGAGAGYIVIGQDIKNSASHSVDISNSVFQTEILAIKDATEYLLGRNIKNKTITFHVDNQAAIRAQENI